MQWNSKYEILYTPNTNPNNTKKNDDNVEIRKYTRSEVVVHLRPLYKPHFITASKAVRNRSVAFGWL